MKCLIYLGAWAVMSCTTSVSSPTRETFAHRVLSFESQIERIPAYAHSRMDSLIEQTRDRYGRATPTSRSDMVHFLQTIDTVLTENSFVFPPCRWTETLGDAFLPHHLSEVELRQILERSSNSRRASHIRAHRNGSFYFVDCDTGAFIYMGIAEAFGVDLDLVDLPEHNFVRWTTADHEPLNWDANYGTEISDQVYAQSYSVTPEQIRHRVYLVSMTDDETQAYLLLIRALRLQKANRNDEAAQALENALRLVRSPDITNNLAWHIVTRPGFEKRASEAVELAREAISLDDTANRRDTLACALALAGRFSEAIDIQKRVVEDDRSEAFEDRLALFQAGKTCIGVLDDYISCQ